jgi:energy-coupling factor transporter ATP-binding protein EcfA2
MGIYNYEYLLSESYIINEPDILYNKDKWDNNEINLLCITGHSGSGKSTLAKSKKKRS